MILTRTPYRVSLFGGGTDYPEWFEEHGGAVLGMAIDKYCYVGVKRMPPGQELSPGVPLKYRVQYSKVDDCNTVPEIKHPAVRAALTHFGLHDTDLPLEFHIFGDLPGRAGLGGSSAFTVGLIHALRRLRDGAGYRHSEWALAREAIQLERDEIKEMVGCQDQIFAAFGGLNHIRFHPVENDNQQAPSVERIVLTDSRMRELERSLVLVYSGIMRDAHVMAQKQVGRMGLAENQQLLTEMHALTEEAYKALVGSQPLARIGRLLDTGWSMKRGLCPEISSPAIDALYDHALIYGAIGGKLLGAGGGGFMLFFVPPDRMPFFEQHIDAPCVHFKQAECGSLTFIDEEEELS